MRIGIVFVMVFATLASSSASAQQTMSCGMAQQQLQGYVNQVNYMTNYEYTQGIPMRCGYNTQCSNWWLMQLNAWYSQQAQLVNGWYQQIAMQCAGNSNPGQIAQTDPDNPIDTGAIDDMEVDDEDKTVKIKIPKNPKGFKPRR